MGYDYNPFGSDTGGGSGNPLADIKSKVVKLGVGGFLATLGVHYADASGLDFAAIASDPQTVSGYQVGAGVAKAAVAFKDDVAYVVREYALPAAQGAVDEAKRSGATQDLRLPR